MTRLTVPAGAGDRLTSAIASNAQPMPISRMVEGCSPRASPKITGMVAEVTAVIGATTVIAPAERAR